MRGQMKLQIMNLILPFLVNEKDKCKAVCPEWNGWITYLDEVAAKAESLFHIPDIVQAIFLHLDQQDRLRSRHISSTFNFVATKYLTFKPILTELTKKAFLKMGPDLRIISVRAAGLYTKLSGEDGEKLNYDFNKNAVKTLVFYEGVSRINKEILIRSFPRLEELKYISTVNFAIPQENVFLELLRKLEIRCSVYDETCSLYLFFIRGRFPALEVAELDLQSRLDFLLYLESHYFVAVHLMQLKKLVLQFGRDFLFDNADVSKMFTTFPQSVCERCHEVATIFNANQNSLVCSLRFLRCEGFGRFQLTTILHENLKRLNPNAQIRVYHDEEDRH